VNFSCLAKNVQMDFTNQLLLVTLRSVNWKVVGNVAAILCVIDCTVVPILVTAVSFLGALNESAALFHFTHLIGFYCMIPIAGLAVISTYIKSHNWKVLLWGLTAWSFIISGHLTHSSSVDASSAHTNDSDNLISTHTHNHLLSSFLIVTGAANLVLSNYLGRRETKDGCCQ